MSEVAEGMPGGGEGMAEEAIGLGAGLCWAGTWAADISI